MQGHTVGLAKGNREGSILNRHTWKFASGDSQLVTGVSQKLCTLPGTTANPFCYKVRIITVVANTASGAVTGSIGTASAGTQVINATSLKATAGTVVAGTNDFIYSEADVDLWITYTVASGTDAAGKFVVIVEAFEVNVTGINTLEA